MPGCDVVLMKSFLHLDYIIYASKSITKQKWLFISSNLWNFTVGVN